MDRNAVVIEGLWQVIKAQAKALATSHELIEHLFDLMPPAEKALAAERMDQFNDLLRSCDDLIKPIKQIMEG